LPVSQSARVCQSVGRRQVRFGQECAAQSTAA